MELQHDKCCYCERKLASARYGKVEHDIEHHRPKSRVKNWFTAKVKAELPDWPAGLGQSGANAKGYHLLPFDFRNYATSCKECNSALKSDYFPCAKNPVLDADSPAAAMTEEPWLIFPVGDLDEPAESLVQSSDLVVTLPPEGARDAPVDCACRHDVVDKRKNSIGHESLVDPDQGRPRGDRRLRHFG